VSFVQQTIQNTKQILVITYLIILLYGLLQFRGFLLDDYSKKYTITQKKELIKLTQEHPSMPGWRVQFISTIINSHPTKVIDTIYLYSENYRQNEIEIMNNYYSDLYNFVIIDSIDKESFDDSVFCTSHFLKRTYTAKWKIQGNNLIVKYGSAIL